MLPAAARDAKHPHAAFTADAARKHAEAGDAIRAAVERHLAGPYARLEQLRAAAATA